ncbi:septin-10 isoform X14 [Grus americana]|uniref:septin-10 isoform X14 n=1 Tax=Grus americana TaxID=9117 RepID=UPI002407CDD9|nr:septin-10 isoform X14 [Grus americana]
MYSTSSSEDKGGPISCYQPIVDYIDAQFEAYLQEELKIKRSLFSYHDTRIHVCLYFISPTGHSLKTLDLLTMKSLDSKVNIIPIIGKADSISKTELQKFKNKIMSELVSNGVQIYQFPTDDETVSKINTIMNGHLPFAVVGSTEEVKVGNKMVRARQYPWGVVQVENENHCDFVKLREMLICTNMEDLREQTHARHYELYRRCRLEEMGFRDVGPENKPVRLPCSKSYAARKTVCHNYASVESLQEAYEAKRNEFYLELQRKEEEMRQQFVQRVKEKEAILKEAEQQYAGKHRYAIAAHCFKNIWTCGTFLEYVVEDLVQSSWTGKTGCSHLLSVRLSHGHVYLSSNTGLIDIGNLCIFINVLFCTSVSQQRCFCKVFRCIF